MYTLPQLVGKALVATSICVALLQVSLAQVMSSTNYKIQSDSVNAGGGRSTSTSYAMESTVGEIATGNSTSTHYELRAGYQQMQEVYLSMTAPTDVTMSPSLGGITGGSATGSTAVVITTDSPSGYQLAIKANSNPAMQASNGTIADYVPAGAVPDFTFVTTATAATFAFTPEGSAVATRYKDNGSICGAGSGEVTLRCWDGLSTTDRVVVSTTVPNHPSGATTTLQFRVNIGGSIVVPSGSYIATTTITALPL